MMSHYLICVRQDPSGCQAETAGTGEGRSRNSRKEAINQEIGDGCAEDRNRRGDKKCLVLGSLKAEQTGCADGVDVVGDSRRDVKTNSEVSGWKNAAAGVGWGRDPKGRVVCAFKRSCSPQPGLQGTFGAESRTPGTICLQMV